MGQDNLIKTLLNKTVSEVRLGKFLSDTYSISIMLTFLLVFQNNVQRMQEVTEVAWNISCLSRLMTFI
jgi:hypothetical protein